MNSLKQVIFSSWVVFLFFLPIHSTQAEDYLKVDPEYLDGNSIRIPEELRTRELHIAAAKLAGTSGNKYKIDLSGFVKGIPFEKLFKISINFPNYLKIPMPNLNQIAVFNTACGPLSTVNMAPQQLITWSAMSYTPYSSSHFLTVDIKPSLNGNDKNAGTSWNLSSKKCDTSKYADASLFETLSGSWFLADAGTIDGKAIVYMRYYLNATTQSRGIGAIFRSIASFGTSLPKEKFKSSVTQLISKLYDYAKNN